MSRIGLVVLSSIVCFVTTMLITSGNARFGFLVPIAIGSGIIALVSCLGVIMKK